MQNDNNPHTPNGQILPNSTPEAQDPAQPQPTVYNSAQYQQPQPQAGAVVMGGQPQPVSPGSYAQATASQEGSKSFLSTYLFSTFLGIFGVDRFYLGKIGTGILKFLTIGGLGFWVLIDQILLLGGHVKAKDGTKLKGYEKDRKTAIIIFIVVWILFVMMNWSFFTFVDKAAKTVNKCSNGCSITFNGSTGTGSNTPQATNVTTDTPLGQTATGTGDAKGWSVSISANQDPQTTGAAPNAGRHYLEVDFTITNNSSQSGLFPGTFYYQTAGGKLYNDTGTQGTGANIDSKNVQLANSNNMQSLVAAAINKGQTDSFYYLLYQVPNGDNGKLIWFDGIYQTTTKLAIFDLN